MDARGGLRPETLPALLAGLWFALALIVPAGSGWCARRVARTDVVVQSIKNVRPEEYTVRGKVAPLAPEAEPRPASQAAPAKPESPPSVKAKAAGNGADKQAAASGQPAPSAPPAAGNATPAAKPSAPAANTQAKAAPGAAEQKKPAVPTPPQPPAAPAVAASLRPAAVHIERGGELARLALDLGGPVTYSLKRMDNPPRLVLDIPGRFRLTTRTTMEGGSGGLSQVRSWAHEDRLRVVIDLADEKLKMRITPTDSGLSVQLVEPATTR